jgi:hypothetical protein
MKELFVKLKEAECDVEGALARFLDDEDLYEQFYGELLNDEAFGKFREMLNYKLFEAGKSGLIKIDRWFPSSKTCHHCGAVNKNLTLDDR